MLVIEGHGLAWKGAEDLTFCPSSAIYMSAM